jgi:uncharacterized protein YdeI (YjbR/CyaY-like superfamily)
MQHDDLPIIPFPSPAAWEDWLEDHHKSSPGLWMKIAKKASGIETISYQDAVESALCFGWIDGQRQTFDDRWFLQRFTPRRSRSRWSQTNRDKVAKLIQERRMRPEGLAEIERAKTDGRWDDAYPGPSTIEVPDDLRQAFDAKPQAREAFAALNATSRYSILYRIHHTKEPTTRARRIEQFVEMLTSGDSI